jgi:hypothetical protein
MLKQKCFYFYIKLLKSNQRENCWLKCLNSVLHLPFFLTSHPQVIHFDFVHHLIISKFMTSSCFLCNCHLRCSVCTSNLTSSCLPNRTTQNSQKRNQWLTSTSTSVYISAHQNFSLNMWRSTYLLSCLSSTERFYFSFLFDFQANQF